jgi:hypothetical protein
MPAQGRLIEESIMAIGVGRRAEPDRSLVRNRRPLKEFHDIPNVPFHAGRKRQLPPLPLSVDEFGQGWPQATYNWWKALRVMPHCFLWSETDWEYALTTAWIHRRVWLGEYRLSGELRMRERAMGCTDEARRGLRIRYVAPETVEAAPVTPLHAVPQQKPVDEPARRRVPAFDPSSLGGK